MPEPIISVLTDASVRTEDRKVRITETVIQESHQDYSLAQLEQDKIVQQQQIDVSTERIAEIDKLITDIQAAIVEADKVIIK